MLHELQTNHARRCACSLSVEDRAPGAPQQNVVMECLDAMSGNREAQEAFAAVLSDYISSVAGGCIPDAGVYKERLAVRG
jgi:hypothetical protein